MKRLFILGNGFDKAHGIRCTYKDFGDFLEEKHWNFFQNICNAFQQDGHLWTQFESVLPTCGVYIEEQGLQMGQEMLEEIDYDPCDDMSIGHWLRSQYEFIRQLPIVLRDWAESVDIEKEQLFDFSDEDQFFSFNYTDTVEKVYGLYDVLHIHGDVGIKNDCLIMGHGNRRDIEQAKEHIRQSQEEFIDYAESTYSVVLHFLESTLKETDRIIDNHRWWFDGLKHVDGVYIIGHSLGNVDMPYFKKIHECIGNESNWFLCYHDKPELLKEQKLRNLGIRKIESIDQRLLSKNFSAQFPPYWKAVSERGYLIDYGVYYTKDEQREKLKSIGIEVDEKNRVVDFKNKLFVG